MPYKWMPYALRLLGLIRGITFKMDHVFATNKNTSILFIHCKYIFKRLG